MKIKNAYLWVLILIGSFLVSGCYTQIKLEDDDYSYKERKRVIIEKRVEKDGEEETVTIDTTYESTDDTAYDEDDARYYYPRHRRAYKYYHPGITIVVGGAVYYDPWYFDYFYYPYVVCRTYYLPWWYGYYSCYRVWYGFAYYDPFYNPFYAPPYWWYDPYWYGGYYPPIVQYRKNDYTRLRDQDGGRNGIVRTGNWGRDLNLQIASDRTRLRDDGIRSDRSGTLDRNKRINRDDNLRTPTLRDNGNNRDRDVNTRTPDRNREPNVRKDTRDEQKPRIPTDRRLPERNPDRNSNRNRDNSDRKDTPDRKQSDRRQYDSFLPNFEQRILIDKEIDSKPRNNDQTTRRNNDEKVRIYRDDRPKIEYDIPRREYQPRFDNSNSNSRDEKSSGETKSRDRNSYNYERPRYESPRYESPRYETPSRNNSPSYTPPSRTYTPPVNQSPRNDRGRDR